MPEITEETRLFLVELLSRRIEEFYDDPDECSMDWDENDVPLPLPPLVEQLEKKLKKTAKELGADWDQILEDECIRPFQVEKVSRLIAGRPDWRGIENSRWADPRCKGRGFDSIGDLYEWLKDNNRAQLIDQLRPVINAAVAERDANTPHEPFTVKIGGGDPFGTIQIHYQFNDAWQPRVQYQEGVSQ